jgi:DNA-directed RNA polymerase beta subunit
LINSLNVYARIDNRGFIISPYLKVKNGIVQNEIEYLTADDEEKFLIAQANTPYDTTTLEILSDHCVVRNGPDILEVNKSEVHYIDVSPLQVFSVSANLIPFLEHDDANRALMGCNMQHQAIPLINPEIPLAGTGLESKAAIDSGSVETSPIEGVVSYVDSGKIVISSVANNVENIKIGHFNKNLINEILCENIDGIGSVEDVIDGTMLNKMFKKGITKVKHGRMEDLEIIKLAELVVYEKNENLIDVISAETLYFSSSNKVLIEEGKRITSTLLNRIFNNKNTSIKVYNEQNEIIDMPVYEIRFVRKENLPDHKVIISSKPVSDKINYGEVLTNEQFMLMNDQSLESLTVISKEKLKQSEIFLQHKKLRRPMVLAKDVIVGSKKIASENEILNQELLSKLIDLGVEELSVGKESEIIFSKFKRTNQDTVVNKHPLVNKGDYVTVNMPIIDGGASDRGRLALGRNLLVAYMPWRGYNYQDAIVLSEKLVVNDVLTSSHIKEYKVSVRETKVGPEEITRDIPNVPEEQLKNLDEDGIILVGTEVGPNDILVGKITPKAESEFTPEMKLWRAMFDKKGQDVKDSSLRVSPGERGTVIGIQVLTREEDDLPIGVNKIVKVYIGEKRKIQVGDKLSGRHGNKGVISRILPVQDMPFLEDGTPVDIVLNSLGVPSRMNVGQIMEALLGFYAKKTGNYCVTPPFSGINPDEMIEKLKELGFGEYGKQVLYDGHTGEPFTSRVTVGYAYIMKLNHMVEDKIHARSTGPYALITQQPLGGKAQFGGQRFGEMEVWALEAYGAAYTLQEMLTIKSDDTEGRLNAYESICTRRMITQSNNPESFRVIINELQGLGIKIDLVKEEEEVIKQDVAFITPLEEKEKTLEELNEIIV